MTAPASLTGVLTHNEYFDPESKFGVWRLLVDGIGSNVIAGVMPNPILGEEVTAYGAFESHIKGNLLSFERYYSRPPRSTKHLVQYLHSLSKISFDEIQALVKVFGEQTLDVIAFRPDRLDEAGLTSESKEKLTKSWANAKDNELVVSLASEFGMSEKIWSKMRIQYGSQVNFSALIKKDPFTIYRVSDAISFQQIMNLANKINVKITDICYVKGAIVALLRQQKVAHGSMLLERSNLAHKTSNLIKRTVSEAELEDAIKQLAADISVVDTSYIAFNDQIDVARSFWFFWAALLKRDTTWEGAPTFPVAKRLLADVINEYLLADSELEDLCTNLDKSFCSINFIGANQMTVWLDACLKIWDYQSANVKIICHSAEAAKYLCNRFNVDNIQHWSEAIIFQEVGPPHFNRQNSLNCDLCIILQAEKFGVHELLLTLEAITLNSAIHLWSVPENIVNNAIGNAYYAATQLSGIDLAYKREEINSKTDFDPSSNVAYLHCETNDIAEAICTIVEECENTLSISPNIDVRVLLFSSQLVAPINESITKRFYKNSTQITVDNRIYLSGQPVIIRETNHELLTPEYSLWNINLAIDGTVEFHSGEDRIWRYSPRQSLMVRSGIVLPVERAGNYWSKVVIVGIHENDCINEDHMNCLLGMAPEKLFFVGKTSLMENLVKSPIYPPRIPMHPKFMRDNTMEKQDS